MIQQAWKLLKQVLHWHEFELVSTWPGIKSFHVYKCKHCNLTETEIK